jgi:hypothetical protein
VQTTGEVAEDDEAGAFEAGAFEAGAFALAPMQGPPQKLPVPSGYDQLWLDRVKHPHDAHPLEYYHVTKRNNKSATLTPHGHHARALARCNKGVSPSLLFWLEHVCAAYWVGCRNIASARASSSASVSG